MKKSVKAAALIGGGIGIGLLIYKWIRNEFDRESEQLKQAHQKTIEGLKEAGVSEEILEKTIEKDEPNAFCKSLFVGTTFNPNFETEMVDPNEVFASFYGSSIHIREYEVKGRKFLEYMLEIPDVWASKSFNDPKIQDYIRCIKEASNHVHKNIVCGGSSNAEFIKRTQPHTKLTGYVTFDVASENGGRKTVMEKLRSAVYEDLKDDHHDGLVKFYELYCNEVRNNDDWEDGKGSSERFTRAYPEYSDIKYEDIQLYFTIAFPIIDTRNPGISYESAIQVLKYFMDEFEISRKDAQNPNEEKYNHLLFHSLDENGEENLLWYYDTKSGKVISKEVSYKD